MGKTYINMPSLSSQPERKKVFNMTLARVKTTFDKSFIFLAPGSCSSRSVMFCLRFTVDIFPLSEQDHPALADTSCDGSSSRGRAKDALQGSAWCSQEQLGQCRDELEWGRVGTPSLTRGETDFSLCI